ncbi:short-chain dehydrogenase/reductase family oxidoreductase [Colletotrichum tofieldiae]|nr:short-chain dehydrogenase/reductase family oxidoreductase [Colletotrichum tofieldiae]GKT71035.1 short-chain dehydrogenase/reductase family oxidoreductase [Colletotrichum tofieldiae]
MKFNIPDLAGKVILVTGGTAGIGKETMLALARHNPAQLYFTGRNAQAAAKLVTEINRISPLVKVEFLECDLADHNSVVNAVRSNFTSDRLDVLIANAGVCATPPATTKDGHEVQFGTNHFGHSVLFKLLLPTLLKTAELPGADVRLVIVASSLYSQAPNKGILFEDIHTTQSNLNTWTRYGQSKLANVLYAAEMARRYTKITTVSLHPGIVGTGMVNGLGFFSKAVVYAGAGFRPKSPEEGARNQLWAATTALKNLRSGAYYEPVGKEVKLSSTARDVNLAKRLWEWTEEQLKALEIQ